MTPIWWLLAFIPALVLLYFLKLKREEVTISSTLLWRRSIEDLHVNAPFQRLRRSLLFWIQLLGLCLLIVAIWRPRCDSVAISGRDVILAIDVSASMKARANGATRFELARDEALALIDRVGRSDRLMLLAYAQEVETVQTLTADRALLLEALSRLSPRDLPTDFPAVVETLSQIARGLDSPDLWIIGDASHGGIEDISGEAERFQYRYVPVGESVANVGIVQADVRRTYGHEVRSELFARIASTFDEATQWTVRLLWEDRIADAREVSLAPKGREGVVFDVSSLKAGRVTLEIEAEDGFPLDDRVVLFIEDPQPIRVLIVGEENPWLDDVLRSSTEVRSARVAKESFPPAELEREILEANPPVVVFDRWLPETIPPAPAIFIGCRPNDGTASVDYAERDWPAIVDWDRLHPVLRDLAFESVRIRRGEVATGAGVGFHCLVDAADGCLVSAQTRPRPGGGTVAAIVLGFDILESNWPLGHFSFPLFFDNAISWLGQAETQRRSRWATGETLVASPRDIARSGVVVEFRDPAGDKRSAVVDSSGRALFGRLERAGIHELLVDGKVVDRFAANLLDASESNLEPRLLKASAEDGNAAGESGAPAGPVVAETSIRASRDLWPWFALAALALVLIEWYVYHRRTYI